jgi:hypothetical protein
MPSVNAKSHPPAQEAKAEAIKASALERLMRLGLSLFVTFFPIVLWALWSLALGADYIEKNAWHYRLEPVQIYVWLLIAAGLLELIAVFLLRKSDQKPRDWVAIVSLVDTGLSILLAVFFWAQISLLIFGTT